MFNRLEIRAQSLFLFRCKDCSEILFRQDDIDEYIQYDSEDFGALQAYSKCPKYQESLDYFILTKDIHLSTLQVDYEINLVKHYHPFFKMYVFGIKCFNCHVPIGFQIETVNENTIWMEGRVLIDTQKISILKQGKNQIPRLLKTLQSRLARKLNLVEQSKKQQVENKEKQLIQKLQKMNIDRVKKDQSLKSQPLRNQIDSRYMKKGTESLQTNMCTNYISRIETTGQNHNSVYKSSLGNQQSSYNPHGSVGSKTITVISGGNAVRGNRSLPKIRIIQKTQQSKSRIQVQDAQDMDGVHFFQLNQQQRDQTTASLKVMKGQILKFSRTLHSFPVIEKFFNQMDRIDTHFTMTQKKSVNQLLQINSLLTRIRKNVIQSFGQTI